MKASSLLIPVFLLFTGYSFQSYATTPCNSSINMKISTDDKELAKDVVISFFQEGYLNHNYDFVMHCLADNYIDHSPASARSNSDAVEILKIVQRQFPDLKITILDIFAEEGMVSTRIRFEGTHSDTCQGIPASGKYVTFEALENFRVNNNKIVESWGYWPDNEILRQITAD